jgi:starch synthase
MLFASEGVSSSLTKFIESSGKPFLPFVPKDAFAEAYSAFTMRDALKLTIPLV